MYEEFWLRYIAFLQEKGLTEKVEDAFKRALHTFVPPSRSDLFLAYCHYKEEAGEIEATRELFANHVKEHPNQVKVLLHQDNFETRNASADHKKSILEDSLESDVTSSQTKAIVYIQLAKKALFVSFLTLKVFCRDGDFNISYILLHRGEMRKPDNGMNEPMIDLTVKRVAFQAY